MRRSPDAGGAASPPPGPTPSPRPPIRLVVAAGLHGAFLLARGRPEGLAFVEGTPAGALRSFWAAAICLPAYLALRLFAWGMQGGPPGGGLGRALAVALIGGVCAWAGFALVSQIVAEAVGRARAWPRFLAAWNWTGVVQHLALLAAAVPAAVGMPVPVAYAAGLAALGYALWLEWFVARTALGLSASDAAGFVLLNLALGLFLHGLGEHLTGG
jgi:hypothetical protein